jgi:hypothetical protein
MRIDQRNAGASVTPNILAYAVDRTFGFGSVTGKFSCQRNSGSVTPPTGFTNYLGAVSLSAYSVPSGEQYGFGQVIEGFNIADFEWGTVNAQSVTLSFWVRSSLTGTFGGSLRNSSVARSYPFSYTVSAANAWEYKTITIPGDTTGTWLTDNGSGIRVNFSLGAGTTVSGTAGAWAGSDFVSATGATSVVGTNGATFYITGVQLEKGSTATSFDVRPYGTELALCQRYCYVLAPGSNNVRAAISGNYAGTNCFPTMYVPVPFRSTSVTLTVSSVSHFKTEQLNGGVQTATSIVLNVAAETAITLTVGVGSSLSSPANLLTDNAAAKLTLSAEL